MTEICIQLTLLQAEVLLGVSLVVGADEVLQFPEQVRIRGDGGRGLDQHVPALDVRSGRALCSSLHRCRFSPGFPYSEAALVLATITVTPGQTYDDQAIYMNGERYYRDCWWDWGRRRCELKRWW